MSFAKFVKTSFSQNTLDASNYISVNGNKKELAKKAVNYDTEIKVYQYEPEMGVMKKVNRKEGTGFTRVFKEVFQNVVLL